MESSDRAVMDAEPKMEQGYGGSSQETSNTKSLNVTDRMVIYNANLSLEIKDYHKVEAIIQEKVATLGGYVVESSIYYSGEDRINGHLTVKVPQKSFHSFINEVESESVKVNDRHVSGNDVTEEFVDLESRLRSKRVVEERLISFMEKATKTEDLLKISSDLAKVQEEIEQVMGRMNYLKNNVDYSTVSISLTERKVNVASIQASENLNTWVKAKSLFIDSINGLLSFFSFLVVVAVGLSPIFVPVLAVVVIFVFYVKRKKKNKPFEG
ncbi:DUF4349 domain-containing protein [Anaerobacillus alkaliphilus]|nr:DUF4349 domain-containing protein [Anaerobacillus alkaliphilus]